MKLLTTISHDLVITKALEVAENVALGEIQWLFTEYALHYQVKVNQDLLSSLKAKLTVIFPSKVAEIRELRLLMENGKEMNLTQLSTLGKILDGYSRIGQGQFNYALDEFTELSQGEELLALNEYIYLRKSLTSLESNTSWSVGSNLPLPFLLAYEISKKITHDVSWLQYPLGGTSSNFELPRKLTKVSLIELKK